MAISDVLLGRRSPECVAGFHKILAHYACPVDALERSKYFWSPALPPNATEAEREAAAAAEEAAKGQELSKLSVPRFLDCLCQEYNRAEGLLEEVVPMLFKDHDTDFSGFLNRRVMCRPVTRINQTDTCIFVQPSFASFATIDQGFSLRSCPTSF
jgi:hypothetical protein